MEKDEFEFVLDQGKTQKTEFKERNSGLDREMVAFSNAQGGRIFLGVDDDNKVSGISIDNALKSSIQDIARNCDPSIDISFEEIEDVEDVLLISVKEGDDKPYRCSGGFYLRQGPNSQKLSRDQILEFSIDQGYIRFDGQINDSFSYPNDFNPERLDRYYEHAGLSPRTSPEKALLNLEVAEPDSPLKLNNAGVLFFADEPSEFVPSNELKCVRFDGTTKTGGIIDQSTMDEDILTNVEEALRFIQKNTRTASKIVDFHRVDRPEYPNEAVRESLLNAVMHRDYFVENAPVHVNIFDDRIEVISPGPLPKGVSLETIGEMSVPRNPLIADLVLRTGLIDKLGTGIQRMKETMQDYGLDQPEFEETNDFFKVFLPGPGENILDLIEEKEGEDLRESGLNERQIEALTRMVNEGVEMTNKKYREEFDIAKKTANRDLNELLEKDLIAKKGAGRGSYYISK